MVKSLDDGDSQFLVNGFTTLILLDSLILTLVGWCELIDGWGGGDRRRTTEAATTTTTTTTKRTGEFQLRARILGFSAAPRQLRTHHVSGRKNTMDLVGWSWCLVKSVQRAVWVVDIYLHPLAFGEFILRVFAQCNGGRSIHGYI